MVLTAGQLEMHNLSKIEACFSFVGPLILHGCLTWLGLESSRFHLIPSPLWTISGNPSQLCHLNHTLQSAWSLL